jgi:phytoene/squalene synthetase
MKLQEAACHADSRARAYYAASIPGTALIPRARSRFVCVRCARCTAGTDEIERSGFDVFGRRARVSAWAKIRTCLGALFGG